MEQKFNIGDRVQGIESREFFYVVSASQGKYQYFYNLKMESADRDDTLIENIPQSDLILVN